MVKKSLAQAKPAAEKGDARAQYVLGRMYDRGWVFPRDFTPKAVAWYRKAAEQGDATYYEIV